MPSNYFGTWFGPSGGGGDTTAPAVTLISPVTFDPDYLIARSTPVVIDISDVTPGLEYISITAKVPGTAGGLLVYAGSPTGAYEAGWSGTTAPITNGYEFSFYPTGFWLSGSLAITVTAIDGAGNKTTTTFSWAVPVPAQTDNSGKSQLHDSVWRWRRRLLRQKCSVISVAIDDNYSSGPGFTLTALALELGRKKGLDRVPWRGGTYTNTAGSGNLENGQ